MNKKRVLITGATSGIGRASAEEFAKLGHEVILHGRSESKIELALKEIKESSSNPFIFGYQAELSQRAEVDKLIKNIKNDFSEIDILINNAGLGPKHSNIWEVNFLATVMLTEAILPLMRNKKGRVINISSEAQSRVELEPFMESTGMEAYAQSKLAIIQYSFYKAREEKEVSIFALDPGSFLKTKMVKETYGREGRDISIGSNAHLKLSLDESLTGRTGLFFCEGREARAHSDAYDVKLQEALSHNVKRIIK